MTERRVLGENARRLAGHLLRSSRDARLLQSPLADEQMRAFARRVLDTQAAEWKGRHSGQQLGVESAFVGQRVEESPTVRTSRPRLLSSAHGRIETVLLGFPDDGSDAQVRYALYSDFIRSVPSASFLLLTHRPVEREVRSIIDAAGASNRSSVLLAPESLRFVHWVQDYFQVGADTSGSSKESCLFTTRGGASESESVARLVADATACRCVDIPLASQAGNVLVGDRFVLVGSDHFAATAALVQAGAPAGQDGEQISDDSAVIAARDLFGTRMDATREIIFVGTGLRLPTRTNLDCGEVTESLFGGVGITQPIFHLDMFISLAGRASDGRYRLVVGSPSLADEILGRRVLPHELNAQFDDIARFLGTHPEFDVVRAPLPVELAKGDESKCYWYYASASNCIVEIDGDAKRVWLPSYGFGAKAYLRRVDEYHEHLWRGWGFEVISLGNYREMAECFGAARCLKKVLSRAEEPERYIRPEGIA